MFQKTKSLLKRANDWLEAWCLKYIVMPHLEAKRQVTFKRQKTWRDHEEIIYDDEDDREFLRNRATRHEGRLYFWMDTTLLAVSYLDKEGNIVWKTVDGRGASLRLFVMLSMQWANLMPSRDIPDGSDQVTWSFEMTDEFMMFAGFIKGRHA